MLEKKDSTDLCLSSGCSSGICSHLQLLLYPDCQDTCNPRQTTKYFCPLYKISWKKKAVWFWKYLDIWQLYGNIHLVFLNTSLMLKLCYHSMNGNAVQWEVCSLWFIGYEYEKQEHTVKFNLYCCFQQCIYSNTNGILSYSYTKP